MIDFFVFFELSYIYKYICEYISFTVEKKFASREKKHLSLLMLLKSAFPNISCYEEKKISLEYSKL